MSDTLPTEAAGWCRCVDCNAEIEPRTPCVVTVTHGGVVDVHCETCADERGLL